MEQKFFWSHRLTGICRHIHLYISGILQIYFTQMLFPFPSTNICSLVGYAKRMVWSNRLAMLLVRRDVLYNAFDLIDESFENINSIFRTFFQEPRDVLIFTDSVTIYISSVKEWTLSWGSSCKVVTRHVFHGVFFTFFVVWAYFVEKHHFQ